MVWNMARSLPEQDLQRYIIIVDLYEHPMEKTKNHRGDPAHFPGTDRLTAEGRSELDDSEFGLPRERKYPMPDAEHVRAAESRFHFAPDDEKPELARRILQKAHRFGVEVHSEHVLRWAKK
jgi:hypothetical protein